MSLIASWGKPDFILDIRLSFFHLLQYNISEGDNVKRFLILAFLTVSALAAEYRGFFEGRFCRVYGFGNQRESLLADRGYGDRRMEVLQGGRGQRAPLKADTLIYMHRMLSEGIQTAEAGLAYIRLFCFGTIFRDGI